MKPQDIVFLGILAILIFFKNPKLLVVAGLASFILAIPLFTMHIFFTAQRLAMYGAGFILLAIISYLTVYKHE